MYNAPPVSLPKDLPDHWLVSTGIHPWLADKDTFAMNCENLQVVVSEGIWHERYSHPKKVIQEWLNTLAQLASNHQIDAIGEIGLDRTHGGNVSDQVSLLESQLEIAEQYRLPIVIHCVRAYPELLAVRKRFHRTPWIIHAYQGNLQIAEQLIHHNCHLSFGARQLRTRKTQAVARAITAQSIFLETDQSDESLIDLYHDTALLLSIDVATLKKNIQTHFEQIFPS